MPPNIDWSNLQYDPDSVVQNENILKLFLQLAVHTANRLMHLRNETNRDHDCNGRKNNLSSSIIEAPITQSLSETNLERSDKSQDEIQNRSFIIDSEIKINDRVLLENLDQDQTTVLNSTQGLHNFQEDTDVARNSKARDLIPMLVQNIQNISSDVTRNYDVHNPDTSQKSNNLYTTSNSSTADNISSDEQNPQNSTTDGINKILFNSINLIENNSNATNMNDLTETVNKFLPESENVRETMPEVNQRFFGIDLAKNIPDMKIINNLHENVNQQLNQWSQNTQKQSDRNNPRFLDETVIQNFKNFLNPQIVNDLPVMSQILSNAKHFVESMIKVLPAPGNAKNGNNLMNHIISQSQNVTDAPLKSIEKNQKYPANFEHNSKAENSDNQSALINNNVTKLEAFEKIDEIKTNYTNEQLNLISKNLFSRNETSEFLKVLETEKPLNQSEFDASQISSTAKYQDSNSNSTLDLQDSENVNKSNVEKPKELQDNPSTKIRTSRSIENRNTRIDNDVLKSNNYFRFVDNMKDTNLHKQLSETKPEISDRLINALLPVIKEKISNSESHMTDYYSVTSGQPNQSLP